MQDGTYQHQAGNAHPIIHCLKVENGAVVDAWVYQVLGEYHEPGFAASMIGRTDDRAIDGYRRIDATEVRNVITLRVTSSERAEIARAADAAGQTVSEYMRARLLQ
jgi:hypothetical protein